MTPEEMVALLPMGPEDVADVERWGKGLLLTTKEGTRYAWLPPEAPDALGRTGLVFVERGPNLPTMPRLRPHPGEELPPNPVTGEI